MSLREEASFIFIRQGPRLGHVHKHEKYWLTDYELEMFTEGAPLLCTAREDDRAELYGVALTMRCSTAGPGRCGTLCPGGGGWVVTALNGQEGRSVDPEDPPLPCPQTQDKTGEGDLEFIDTNSLLHDGMRRLEMEQDPIVLALPHHILRLPFVCGKL